MKLLFLWRYLIADFAKRFCFFFSLVSLLISCAQIFLRFNLFSSPLQIALFALKAFPLAFLIIFPLSLACALMQTCCALRSVQYSLFKSFQGDVARLLTTLSVCSLFLYAPFVFWWGPLSHAAGKELFSQGPFMAARFLSANRLHRLSKSFEVFFSHAEETAGSCLLSNLIVRLDDAVLSARSLRGRADASSHLVGGVYGQLDAGVTFLFESMNGKIGRGGETDKNRSEFAVWRISDIRRGELIARISQLAWIFFLPLLCFFLSLRGGGVALLLIESLGLVLMMQATLFLFRGIF